MCTGQICQPSRVARMGRCSTRWQPKPILSERGFSLASLRYILSTVDDSEGASSAILYHPPDVVSASRQRRFSGVGLLSCSPTAGADLLPEAERCILLGTAGGAASMIQHRKIVSSTPASPLRMSPTRPRICAHAPSVDFSVPKEVSAPPPNAEDPSPDTPCRRALDANVLRGMRNCAVLHSELKYCGSIDGGICPAKLLSPDGRYLDAPLGVRAALGPVEALVLGSP